MYMNIRDTEKERFSIGDIIVPCSSIKITHVNDNRPPFKEIAKKAIIWILIIAMACGLVFL